MYGQFVEEYLLDDIGFLTDTKNPKDAEVFDLDLIEVVIGATSYRVEGHGYFFIALSMASRRVGAEGSSSPHKVPGARA
jgi:hypothetical protein